MQILLVDDEVELTEPLSRILKREGYGVDVAHEGAVGGWLAQQNHYDLLILDWMLPQISGIEICQQLRAQGKPTPVLFLTAKDTLDDRVAGLDAGGDDYLIKPFELRELLARVRALLRRPAFPAPPMPAPSMPAPSTPPSSETLIAPVPPPILRVADLELDLENQLAYRGTRKIELSEKESQLLAYLMRHPHQLLGHEQIYEQVWGGSEKLNSKPNSNVLAAQIRLLRRKIEAESSPLIHTVYGRGYRFGETGSGSEAE
jgi:two-component system, OmpR family, manganese sensing response regulator